MRSNYVASSAATTDRSYTRRTTCRDIEGARRDVFDYIKLFYNPERRYGYNHDLAAVEFERQYLSRLDNVY